MGCPAQCRNDQFMGHCPESEAGRRFGLVGNGSKRFRAVLLDSLFVLCRRVHNHSHRQGNDTE
jgi:hypothetical protein